MDPVDNQRFSDNQWWSQKLFLKNKLSKNVSGLTNYKFEQMMRCIC